MNGYHALATISKPRRHFIGDSAPAAAGGWADMIPMLAAGAGELVKKGVEYKQQEEAQAAKTKSSSEALQAVLNADALATQTAATAMLSAEAKLPSMQADILAATQTGAAQDAAAFGLSPENQKKRTEAASKAIEKATKEWQAALAAKNVAKAKIAEFKVKAAQLTYAKTQNAAMVAQVQSGQMPMPPREENWLTRKSGPLPNWAWVLIVLATLGGGAALVVKLVR